MDFIIFWCTFGWNVLLFGFGAWLFYNIVTKGPAFFKGALEFLDDLFKLIRKRVLDKMKKDEEERASKAEKEAAKEGSVI